MAGSFAEVSRTFVIGKPHQKLAPFRPSGAKDRSISKFAI